MEISLESIEKLRERAKISYREAKELLEQTGGDLIEALVRLEESGSEMLHGVSQRGKDIYRQATKLAGQMHRTRVKVKVKDKTLLELPVTIGALGAALFPKVAALGLIGLLVSRGSLEVKGGIDVPPEGCPDEGGE